MNLETNGKMGKPTDIAASTIPSGHPAKNREEFNAQIKDRTLFEENNEPNRYIEPISE
jgi:hypothetical protein